LATLLFHQTTNKVPPLVQSIPHYSFTHDDIDTLGCPMIAERFVPGSIHLPMLRFFLDHPDFDFYWFVEDDVRFTGDWRHYFEQLSRLTHDFLACHIRRYEDEPNWNWWKLDHPHNSIPFHNRLRSFNPVCRFSNRALRVIHEANRDGWCGHQEMLVPTLLHHRKCTMADIGGHGSFVPAGFRNRFYIDARNNREGALRRGTMRFRPLFKQTGWRRNKLYHPVRGHIR
jgi:hypothetical protein